MLELEEGLWPSITRLRVIHKFASHFSLRFTPSCRTRVSTNDQAYFSSQKKRDKNMALTSATNYVTLQ
jgi:hypothetical protein